MITFVTTAHLERENSEVISIFKDGKFVATIISNADNEDAIRLITTKDKGSLLFSNETSGNFIQWKIKFEDPT